MAKLTIQCPFFDLMVANLADAARELFADYDIVVRPAIDQPNGCPDDAIGLAVIGYAGRGVRGALVLMTAESAVSAWMKAAGVPDGDVADTLGEFSNMLLGRLKGRLLPLGISILATTPTAALGSGFRLSDPPGPSSWSAVDGPDWRLRLRLDADFAPGFKPLDSPGGTYGLAGDAIEFDPVPGEDAT